MRSNAPYELSVAILRDGNKVIGIEVVAGPTTEGECFCRKMRKGLAEETASFEFVGDGLIITNPVCGWDEPALIEMAPSDVKALRDIFESRIAFRYLRGSEGLPRLPPAFKIVLDEYAEKDPV